MAKKKKKSGKKTLYAELTPKVTQNDQIVDTARQAKWRVKVKGVDVTDEIKKDLISIDVKDIEDTEADDLQIRLSDPDGKWLTKWLNDTVQKGSSGAKGLSVSVYLGMRDHTGKVVEQNNGRFILDTMSHSGPPSVATLKCTSVDFKGEIRSEEKEKTWASFRLKSLTKKVAKAGGLKYYYQPKSNPKYTKITQNKETDLAFLIRCCRNKGYCVKICGKNMVVYDPKSLENNATIHSFSFKDGQYTRWDCDTSSCDTTYDHCTVQYTNPSTGKVIKATYKSKEYEKNEEHTLLSITNKKVKSKKEAKKYAKIALQLKNKFERTCSLTIPGNPAMMSGLTIDLKGFGYWTGKYMIHEATHQITSSGYSTKLDLRYID